MKKVLLIAVLLCCFLWSWAIPAYPGAVVVTQADGQKITLQLHGDEFFHYTTSVDGYLLSQGGDGFYYYVQSQSRSLQRAHDPAQRSASEQAFLGSCQRGVDFNSANVQRQANIQSMLGSEASRSEQQQAPNLATKGLVILVNFSDVPFSVSAPNNAFTNMLNQKGYSRNGATGSAKDYFKATSFGKYNPDFTVVGPVNIPGTMKFYGENNTSKKDINAAQMVVDACNEADKAGVNFADYDSNNDGQVDNVFIYYAGYNEAEYGGENTIWPHKSNIISRNLQLDGKYIGPYACSSEYKGAGTGKVMAGIGTFCHEFGHVLGLMDMYDTEYNGNRGLDKLSIMSMGGYNNGGNTPPLWNALERQTTGWGEYAVFNDQSSKVSLAPINISNQGYMIPTSTRGEYFVIEVRDCTVPGTWDYWIDVNHQAKGLVIYQVDQSFNMVGGMFASQRWSSNRINTVLGHECMRMLLPETYYFKPIDAFWPTSSVKSFIRDGREPARDWNRKPLPYELTDITLDKDIVSFNVKSVGQTATITGIVLSEDGTPLAGASVSLRATPILNKSGQILSAVSLSSPLSRSPLGEQYTTITDVNGNFSLKDVVQGPYDLVISEYRHITYVQTVNLQKESEYLGEFTLVLVQQKLMKEVSRSNGATDGYFTISNVSSGAVVSVSNYWTAENIAADTLTKDVIRAIAFQTYQSMNVEGKVFFDDVLAFTGRTQSTTSGRTIIGVDGGLNIPAGKSMRIAFSFTPLKDGAVVAMDGGAVVKGGNLYSLDKGVTWSEQVGGGNFVVSYLRDKGSDEMSKANIRGQAFQREAFVEWFSLDANVREWSIQLAQKGQPSQDIPYKGGQSLSIDGLTPGVNYTVSVAPKFNGQTGPASTLTLQTEALSSPYPAIWVVKNPNNTILRLRNLARVPESVEWTIDGKQVDTPLLIFDAGQTQKRVSVKVIWDSQHSETISRTIFLKQ